MLPNISPSQINIYQRAGLIKCQSHPNNLICGLDIRSSIDLGERVFCPDCKKQSANILLLKDSEQLFKKALENEQQQLQQTVQPVIKQFQRIQEQIKLIESKLNACILQLIDQSQLLQLAKIFSSDSATLSSYQELATYFSLNVDNSYNIKIPPKNINQQLISQMKQVEQTLKNINIDYIVQIKNKNLQLIDIPFEFPSKHQEIISSMAISDDSNLIATGDLNGLVIFWDPFIRKAISKIQDQDQTKIFCLAFNSNKTQLASGCNPGIIQIWDISNLEKPNLILQQTKIGFNLEQIFFLKHSYQIIYSGYDKPIFQQNLQHKEQPIQYQQELRCFTISNNDNYVVGGSSEGVAYIWINCKLQVKWQATQTNQTIQSIAITQDCQKLLTFGKKEGIKLWDIYEQISNQNSNYIRIYKVDSDQVSISRQLYLMNNDKLIVAQVQSSKKILLFMIDNEQPIQTINTKFLNNNIACSPNSEYLLVSGISQWIKEKTIYQYKLKEV